VRISENQRELLLVSVRELVERFLSARRQRRLHAPTAQHSVEDAPVGGIVIDDESGKARKPAGRQRLEGFTARGLQLKFGGEVERASFPGLARQSDPAAHHLHDSGGDCEPEAGAPVPARRRAVLLLERLEYAFLVFRRDADSGVADAEVKDGRLLGAVVDFDAENDFPGFGELDRVSDEIHDHLPQSSYISDKRVGHFRGDFEHELETLLIGAKSERADGVGETLPKSEFRALDIEAARLDLGEIEDVVDDVDQSVGGAARCLDVLPLIRREVGVERELEHSEHAIHGCPDLVAHVREELALGYVRGFCCFTRAKSGELALRQRMVRFLELLGANEHSLLELRAKNPETLFTLRDRLQVAVLLIDTLSDVSGKAVTVVAHPQHHENNTH
jgi:hypothetical protein